MPATRQKKPRSRGKKTSTRSERLELRLTRDQKRQLLRSSAREGKTLSAFVIDSALQAANDETVIRLSPRDSKMVAEMFASPPRQPTEAALRAVELYRRKFKGT